MLLSERMSLGERLNLLSSGVWWRMGAGVLDTISGLYLQDMAYRSRLFWHRKASLHYNSRVLG
jgi:hypothetical protein